MKVIEVNSYLCYESHGDTKPKVIIADNIADACDIYYTYFSKYPTQVALTGVSYLKSPSRYVNDTFHG